MGRIFFLGETLPAGQLDRLSAILLASLLGLTSCNEPQSNSSPPDLSRSADLAANPDSSPSDSGTGSGTGSGLIVFNCNATVGGICTMNSDGSGRQTLRGTGWLPHSNAAGDILFHEISGSIGTVEKRMADGTITSLGNGANPRWTPGGGVVFNCSALGGGICTMNADGSNRQTLRATGWDPDSDAAGDILFHEISGSIGTVEKRLANGTVMSLGNGADVRWTPGGGIVFDCDALGGGLCTMNADGSNRQTLRATGWTPDSNAAGDILFHETSGNNGTVEKRLANGTVVSLGSGADACWNR